MAVKTCNLKSFTPDEGITSSMEKKLRSRRKTHATQTQEETWEEIYRMLFPLDSVPSPYFEAATDYIQRSPGSVELSSYEEYSRQELPRIFRRALEAAVGEQALPIENVLRNRLVEMIQECQNHVFTAYRSRQAASSATVDLAPAIDSLFSFVPAITNQEQIPNTYPNSTDPLQNFYQQPLYQSHALPAFDFDVNTEALDIPASDQGI
ncbi:hypothetical protein HYALB_00013107 [Hymenoscyphus albidus]|uniref:Uncharacterized protein n=1 Tax=Hymenoscyphus albidus TaxID=595503 RepID=A0A9N9PXF1_9HELO|nr:hypothetical protein HYALB_00013107 [Hymenoscyphus albidus]